MTQHFKAAAANGEARAFDLPFGPFWVDLYSFLISHGNERFVHSMIRDVTHRREMMDQLLKAEQLAAAGTFAAGVAHEVNNPLASISSLVQSLLSGETDAARRTTLHTILSQITRISRTLNDLVNFARPSSSQGKVVDLNSLVTDTLRFVAYSPRFGGIKVEPELASDLKPVFADGNEIQQVLMNLLFNAADATHRQHGIIRVATANIVAGSPSACDPVPDSFSTTAESAQNGGRDRVMLRVTDNGIGIPPEHLKRVFDPFFTTKPAGSGVGLGLSLCQRIILANGGTIKIESEVGKGTSVSICLPSHEAAPRAPAALQ